MPEDKRPASVATAIKECDPMYFPNLRTFLQIACTLPVTSCECEPSASTLRRLHNYMRASMGQERTTALALMHIHYNSDIDLSEVVNIDAQMHPRRMELEYLFFIIMLQFRNIDFLFMVPMVGANHPRWPELCYRELLHLLGSHNPCPTAAVLMEPVPLVFKVPSYVGSRLSYVKAICHNAGIQITEP
ncbi:hypothetical protein EMCRGX_G016820 [Ephydatia muelleri]